MLIVCLLCRRHCNSSITLYDEAGRPQRLLVRRQLCNPVDSNAIQVQIINGRLGREEG